MDGRESHFRKKIKCLGEPAVQSVSLTFSGRLESSVDVLMTTYGQILGRFENVFKTIQKRFGNDHKRYGSRLKVVRY